jgi:hypothetical protein
MSTMDKASPACQPSSGYTFPPGMCGNPQDPHRAAYCPPGIVPPALEAEYTHIGAWLNRFAAQRMTSYSHNRRCGIVPSGNVLYGRT